jgi:hypothetical protein
VGRPTRDRDILQEMLVTVARVCDGLAFAHSRGVLHCDVKPENIMVGSFGQVYLMDWGVACLLSERPVASWLPTQIPARNDPATRVFRGGLNGTPAFMSPEQAFGYTHLVDERTDVFGLGAVLYTILLGRPPFGGSQINAVIADARSCSIMFDGAGASAPLPLELCRITARAMARDPAHRYQTILDLQAGAASGARGGAAAARRDSSSPRRLVLVGGEGAAEGVHPAPGAGDVEQLDAAQRLRDRRVDDHVLAVGVQPQQRAQHQQRRARRPRLRAARGRVLDRVAGLRARVAAERLGQPPVEQVRRLQDRAADARRLGAVAVAPQAPRDERAVVRPDRADVVADRVVRALAGRPSSGCPSPRTARRSSGA